MRYPEQTDNYDVDIFNSNFRELAGDVISLDTAKFDKAEARGLFNDVTFNRGNGVITFTRYDGSVKTIDTLLEKLAVNFDFDPQTQRLIITLDDGEVKYIDLSALITQYEFLDSDTVTFTLDGAGNLSAKVREGSIGEKHLRPNYLADIKAEVAKADASAASAAESKQAAADAEAIAVTSAATATQKAIDANEATAIASQKSTEAIASAISAESFAHGGTGTREDEDTDNAKEYAKKAKESANKAESIAGGKYIPESEKGVAGGVALLDESGKLPRMQLPDDIGNVTGIKGNKESNYRTGDVNLTPADIGALPENNYVELTSAYLPYQHARMPKGSSGYIKLKINANLNRASNMFSATIRIYQGWIATDILISGEILEHWYSPKAIMLGCSDDIPITVHFGYDEDGIEWIMIPAANYYGVSVLGMTDGYGGIPNKDKANYFVITNESSISGTTQASITAIPPVKSQAIKKLEKVSVLPADAASHPDTLYVVMG